jgi:hypothetical protein
MIVKFGFINAKYVSDRWHLLESGLLKQFGKSCHDSLRSHLLRMIMVTSNQIFEETLQSGRALLLVQPIKNDEWFSSLDKFATNRETYAQYCLDLIRLFDSKIPRDHASKHASRSRRCPKGKNSVYHACLQWSHN